MRGKITNQLYFLYIHNHIYENAIVCSLTTWVLGRNHTLMVSGLWWHQRGCCWLGWCWRIVGKVVDYVTVRGNESIIIPNSSAWQAIKSVQHAPLAHQISMRLESVSISTLTALAWWLDPDGADRNVLAWWVSDLTLEGWWTAHCGASASASA